MNQTISTAPRQWFFRGLLVGILIVASLNSVSYFFRSDGMGNLLGTTPQHREAIGFPFELWESGNHYGGYFADYFAMLLNGAVALGVGAVCGLVVLRFRVPLTRMVKELEQLADGELDREPNGEQSGNVQISLRGMMAATVVSAIIAAVARYAMAGQPAALAVIYVLGPWVLILIAFLPLGISWQIRVMILVPAALLMMAGAAVIGGSLEPGLEFDKVLLAIFVCWTPQTALAAIGLTGWLVLGYMRSAE